MQRYELIRLAQLVFSLLLMFGAFLGGLAVGWWRWGKSGSTTGSDQRGDAPRVATGGFRPQPSRPQVSSDLFTPAEPSAEPIEEPPRAVGTSFTPGPRELAPTVDPFQR